MMRIAVIGAGAIGGMLAVRLALSGQTVTVVEKGAHLEAIGRNGLKLVHNHRVEEIAKDLHAVANCVAAGLQDLVLLALKFVDIRSEIWLKLWGNMSFNPISALTHATLVDICRESATHELAADMMREAQAVAEKLGVTFRVPLDKRIEGAAKIGKHKTSTLQ